MHKGTAERPFKHFKDFLRKYVYKERRIMPFVENLHNFTDFLYKGPDPDQQH